jgi:hypothetical protein
MDSVGINGRMVSEPQFAGDNDRRCRAPSFLELTLPAAGK